MADRAVARAADAAEAFVLDGLEAAMNRFNTSSDGTIETTEEEAR